LDFDFDFGFMHICIAFSIGVCVYIFEGLDWIGFWVVYIVAS
jgi:hypothetical protein